MGPPRDIPSVSTQLYFSSPWAHLFCVYRYWTLDTLGFLLPSFLAQQCLKHQEILGILGKRWLSSNYGSPVFYVHILVATGRAVKAIQNYSASPPAPRPEGKTGGSCCHTVCICLKNPLTIWRILCKHLSHKMKSVTSFFPSKKRVACPIFKLTIYKRTHRIF